MLYGFNREHSRILKGVARREGLKARTATTVRYPKPIPESLVIRVGIADEDIAKGATGTISIYNARTEADTDVNVEAKALGEAIEQGLWVTVIYLDGAWLVFPWECA